MPKGKSRKFIDKNNSVTFHLVHRSQQDPLAADETAPQRVLVPVDDAQTSKTDKKIDPQVQRKEELKKYGITFDDNYDYLQHLKDVNKLAVEWAQVEPLNNGKNKDAPKINLPSSVFASSVEEPVGLLNRAVPSSGLRLDVDPDVVAAMDEDFDFDNPDNELEDNFLELANGGAIDGTFDEADEDEMDSDDSSGTLGFESDEERDEVGSLNGTQYSFRDEETKSRFTEYSMSSSVIRRNEQLSLLDGRFENMYAAYDENEIGALDCEEIEGYVGSNSERLLQYAAEFEEMKNEPTQNMIELMKDRLKIIEREDSDSDDDVEKLAVEPREHNGWDCESILSTCSTLYNHPKLISEPKALGKIKINKRTGIPQNVLTDKPGKLTLRNVAQLNKFNETMDDNASVAETARSRLSELSIRPVDETPEQRKERKKALKDYRKERRIQRKATTQEFKEWNKRQEKIMLNNKNNIQGNRIL